MRIVWLLLVVLLLFCTAFFGALIHSRAWGKRFAAVHAGESRDAVEQQAGTPARTMRCTALPEPPAGCQTVLVYSGPLSAVMPEFWLIPLNGDDRVLRVFHSTRAD